MMGRQFQALGTDGGTNQRALVSELLAQGDPLEELLCKPGIDAQWLLREAARHNLVEKMSELVDRHGADVDATSDCPRHGTREPPLSTAAEDGSVAAVAWLLERGADAEGRSVGTTSGGVGGGDYTALWAAAQNGNVRIAQLLLNAGADVNTAKNPTGNTALFMAVQNGHKAMVTLLLRHGADPNKGESVPPIAMAVGTARLALVAQLIHAGVPIPTNVMSTVAAMRRSKSTVVHGYTRKVSEEEMNSLEELLTVNSDLEHNESYAMARAAERKGRYREALRLLEAVPSCAQLKFDVDRIIEAVYGVRGSDGRISVWNRVPVMSERQPRSLQFYAWTRHGRKIYTHGGVDVTKNEQVPSTDELWVLDVDTREWFLQGTTGKTPGPRSGHTMFSHGNALYLWGGKSLSDISDSKLYRLNLDTFTWEVVKTKGSLRPPAREEHAGVLYDRKYYITGGNLASRDLADDLWCLNMSNFKWSALKRGPTERHCHGMWAANGRLFVLGGRTVEKHIENPIKASHSIEDFVSYDIEKKQWSSVRVMGDSPYDISEYTVLPLYRGQKEPSSIIVWGGYTEIDQMMGHPTKKSLEAKYGSEYQEFTVPYRKRLLRFDVETQVWTLLASTRDLLPKAQSFAAEMQSANGQTQLLIGGGYGYTLESKSGLEFEKNVDPWILEQAKRWESPAPEYCKVPEPSKNIYELTIADERGMCSARDDLVGKSWAWDFYDLPGDKRPAVRVDISPCSPTLHQAIDLSFEDFRKPPCDSVRPNDGSTLGARVKLHGLKGRTDLNGQVGRCGPWLEDKERYQVFLPSYEPGGPAAVSVKASNLLVALPFDADDGKPIADLAASGGGSATFPSVVMSFVIPKNKLTRPPLDYIVKGNLDMNAGGYNIATDTYHGPVSAKAQAVLRTIAEGDTAFKSNLSCMFLPTKSLKGPAPRGTDQKKREEQVKKHALFVDFYSKLKEKDACRVNKFESSLLKRQGSIKCGPWLKIVVTIDGLHPSVRRELIVSPDITMQCLHHQVLCPAIGWTNNFHCYAFRRIHGFDFVGEKRPSISDRQKMMRDSLDMMSEECWIGPKTSTALDSMFQPLYIGGALANDKKITLGELFEPNELGEMNLQYIHDFGDWWSHSICVSRYDGQVPSNASVAHIISGEGGCPPEDVGGLENYALKMSRLTGKMKLEKDDEFDDSDERAGLVDPTSERWWDVLNSEVRRKLNGSALTSPLEFDLETTRAKLEIAIRRPKQKVGNEKNNVSHHDCLTGLVSEVDDLTITKQKDPKKFCAVCGVTVALKTCSGCDSIAFCCREHQVDHWPEHKAECKRIKKMKKEAK